MEIDYDNIMIMIIYTCENAKKFKWKIVVVLSNLTVHVTCVTVTSTAKHTLSQRIL